MSVSHRLNQGLRALILSRRRAWDASPPALLSPAQAVAFAGLPHFDRVHLIAVYERLVRDGEADRDLLLAALLHDVGKCRAANTASV
jgi:hypothetical protein